MERGIAFPRPSRRSLMSHARPVAPTQSPLPCQGEPTSCSTPGWLWGGGTRSRPPDTWQRVAGSVSRGRDIMTMSSRGGRSGLHVLPPASRSAGPPALGRLRLESKSKTQTSKQTTNGTAPRDRASLLDAETGLFPGNLVALRRPQPRVKSRDPPDPPPVVLPSLFPPSP